jgi:hypothetical protein
MDMDKRINIIKKVTENVLQRVVTICRKDYLVRRLDYKLHHLTSEICEIRRLNWKDLMVGGERFSALRKSICSRSRTRGDVY